MTLYLIGLGLGDERDITLKGLEAIRACDKVYLEDYTSLLQCSLEDLEKLYHQKITIAPRSLAEEGASHIVEEAKTKNVAFLVIGDPFSATTHIELVRQSFYQGVEVKIINNASILTAIGITGLQLYKFGRTTSIPFPQDVPSIETPYQIIRENRLLGMHTLILLDLKPEQQQFLTISQALNILEEIELWKKEGVISNKMLVVGCSRLGSDDYLIKAGSLENIKAMDFGKPPYCLIIPGKLHFMEEEVLELWQGR